MLGVVLRRPCRRLRNRYASEGGRRHRAERHRDMPQTADARRLWRTRRCSGRPEAERERMSMSARVASALLRKSPLGERITPRTGFGSTRTRYRWIEARCGAKWTWSGSPMSWWPPQHRCRPDYSRTEMRARSVSSHGIRGVAMLPAPVMIAVGIPGARARRR